MEDVGSRGIVDDDDLVEVSTQSAQVLHVVPSVEDARLTEEATPKRSPFVQQVGHWICILPPGLKTNTHVKPSLNSIQFVCV